MCKKYKKVVLIVNSKRLEGVGLGTFDLYSIRSLTLSKPNVLKK